MNDVFWQEAYGNRDSLLAGISDSTLRRFAVVNVGPWDRLRLEQVAGNLLSNAIKYGPGQPVEVRVHRDGRRGILAVADRGIGVAPEEQQRIFDRFERAVTARHFGGLGLGLWIAREIVTRLGGSVRVESQPGQGATFTVELPLAQEGGGAEPGDAPC